MKHNEFNLVEESKKENLLYSKELNDLIDPVYKNHSQEDTYFEAVFNKKKIILEYISISFKKNRVKIRSICDASSIETIINALPETMSVFFKDKEIKKINFEPDDNISLSIKKKGYNYIVVYIIKSDKSVVWS